MPSAHAAFDGYTDEGKQCGAQASKERGYRMSIATVMQPLIPWSVVGGVALAGVGLEALLRWNDRFAAFGFLRGVLAPYALALGISLAPFSYTGKSELIEDRIVSMLVIVASVIVIERLVVQSIASFGRMHATALSSASLLVSVVRMAVLVIGALILFQSLGIAIAPIITALGVGGLAVALALQTTLANLFAGIQIIAARQMRPGDFIKLADGNAGYINDISWRTTSIRDLYNNVIVVPNAALAAATLTNYSLPDHRVLTSVKVMVRHRTPLPKAEQLALEIARSVGKDPFVRFEEITDGGIALAAFFTVAGYADQLAAKSQFVKRFYEQAAGEGMMLPSQPWAEMGTAAAGPAIKGNSP
jgi:small-conductance mechanosensitive channel